MASQPRAHVTSYHTVSPAMLSVKLPEEESTGPLLNTSISYKNRKIDLQLANFKNNVAKLPLANLFLRMR
jgi:hypothetical protein